VWSEINTTSEEIMLFGWMEIFIVSSSAPVARGYAEPGMLLQELVRQIQAKVR